MKKLIIYKVKTTKNEKSISFNDSYENFYHGFLKGILSIISLILHLYYFFELAFIF